MTRPPTYDYDMKKIKQAWDIKPTLRSIALKLRFNPPVFTMWFRRNWEVENKATFVNKKTGERI